MTHTMIDFTTELSIEEAFNIRERMLATTGELTNKRLIIENILKGVFDKAEIKLDDRIDLANDELEFLNDQ